MEHILSHVQTYEKNSNKLVFQVLAAYDANRVKQIAFGLHCFFKKSVVLHFVLNSFHILSLMQTYRAVIHHRKQNGVKVIVTDMLFFVIRA